MPFVNMKKASSQAGGGKSFAVRVTTMDAELEFSYIEVCSLKTTQSLYYMFTCLHITCLLTNPELLNFPTIKLLQTSVFAILFYTCISPNYHFKFLLF